MFEHSLYMYACIPEAARTSVARVGKEKVRNMNTELAEKLVPSPESFSSTLLLCGPVVFLSYGVYM